MDLMVQEIGYKNLTELGFKLVSAANPSQFLDDGPTNRLIRQILGAIAEFDRSLLVHRLRQARERTAKGSTKRTLTGNVKVAGYASRLSGPDNNKIKTTLCEWLDKPALEKGDISKMQHALAGIAINSKSGKPLSRDTVKQWYVALKATIAIDGE